MADTTSSGPTALQILEMQNRDSDEYSDSGGGGGGATPIASDGNIFDLLNSSMEGPGSALKFAGLSAANMDFGVGDFKSMFEGAPLFKNFFGNIQTQSLFPTIDYLANARNIMMTNPLNAPVPGILKSSQGMSH